MVEIRKYLTVYYDITLLKNVCIFKLGMFEMSLYCRFYVGNPLMIDGVLQKNYSC